MPAYGIYRSLSVGWMVLIFILSSQSSLPIPSTVPGLDKLLHGLAYGVFAYLISRTSAALELVTLRRVLLVSVLVTAYGITDEIHQSFVPGRDASLWDVVADGAGALVMTQLIFWRSRRATV